MAFYQEKNKPYKKIIFDKIDQIIDLGLSDPQKRLDLLSEIFENASNVLKNSGFQAGFQDFLDVENALKYLMRHYWSITLPWLTEDLKNTKFYMNLNSEDRKFWLNDVLKDIGNDLKDEMGY